MQGSLETSISGNRMRNPHRGLLWPIGELPDGKLGKSTYLASKRVWWPYSNGARVRGGNGILGILALLLIDFRDNMRSPSRQRHCKKEGYRKVAHVI